MSEREPAAGRSQPPWLVHAMARAWMARGDRTDGIGAMEAYHKADRCYASLTTGATSADVGVLLEHADARVRILDLDGALEVYGHLISLEEQGAIDPGAAGPVAYLAARACDRLGDAFRTAHWLNWSTDRGEVAPTDDLVARLAQAHPDLAAQVVEHDRRAWQHRFLTLQLEDAPDRSEHAMVRGALAARHVQAGVLGLSGDPASCGVDALDLLTDPDLWELHGDGASELWERAAALAPAEAVTRAGKMINRAKVPTQMWMRMFLAGGVADEGTRGLLIEAARADRERLAAVDEAGAKSWWARATVAAAQRAVPEAFDALARECRDAVREPTAVEGSTLWKWATVLLGHEHPAQASNEVLELAMAATHDGFPEAERLLDSLVRARLDAGRVSETAAVALTITHAAAQADGADIGAAFRKEPWRFRGLAKVYGIAASHPSSPWEAQRWARTGEVRTLGLGAACTGDQGDIEALGRAARSLANRGVAEQALSAALDMCQADYGEDVTLTVDPRGAARLGGMLASVLERRSAIERSVGADGAAEEALLRARDVRGEIVEMVDALGEGIRRAAGTARLADALEAVFLGGDVEGSEQLAAKWVPRMMQALRSTKDPGDAKVLSSALDRMVDVHAAAAVRAGRTDEAIARARAGGRLDGRGPSVALLAEALVDGNVLDGIELPAGGPTTFGLGDFSFPSEEDVLEQLFGPDLGDDGAVLGGPPPHPAGEELDLGDAEGRRVPDEELPELSATEDVRELDDHGPSSQELDGEDFGHV